MEDIKEFLKKHIKEKCDIEAGLKKTFGFINKKTKKKTNQKKTSKVSYMNRKAKKEMGLFHLPRRGMKYVDALPMNELWTEYMKNQLELNGKPVPQIHEKGWDSFSVTVYKSDFHGALISVEESKCPSLVGLCGICLIETKNTFKLLCKDNLIKTIPKEGSLFKIHFGEIDFLIYGKHISKRPAERSVRISKAFSLAEL